MAILLNSLKLRPIADDFCFASAAKDGFLLRSVRRFSIHAKARRLGTQDINFLHFLEHKNYFIAIDFFVRHVFSDSGIRSRYDPFPFLSWNLNLYKLYTIRKGL